MAQEAKVSEDDATPRTENGTPEETEKETPETKEEEETSSEDETSQEEKPEEKSKELQSALAQKDYQREKREKAEKRVKELEEEVKSQKPKPEEGTDEWKSKVEFLLQNNSKNYSEEEFDHIAVVATRSGRSLDEAAKDEDEYIQFKRGKVAKKKGTPSPSSPSSLISGKSEKDIEDMNPEEYKKFLDEDAKKTRGRREY